jgi:hypothetical protein
MRSKGLAFVAALMLSACMDTLEPDVGELIAGVCKNEDTDPEVDVSFEAEILPRLRGCGCHNPTTSGSAIDSTGFSVGDHASILRGGQQGKDKNALPGNPCGSYLYQKLSDSPPSGSRMPTNGPYWSRGDMALLHDWIAEGARAN